MVTVMGWVTEKVMLLSWKRTLNGEAEPATQTVWMLLVLSESEEPQKVMDVSEETCVTALAHVVPLSPLDLVRKLLPVQKVMTNSALLSDEIETPPVGFVVSTCVSVGAPLGARPNWKK